MVPEALVTDNGHQYNSWGFAAFCNHWGINHITSSPLYPKSNRFREWMVQTVKNLLKKAEPARQDLYLACLSYQTMPIDSNLPSPAKVQNQRDYYTQLPCSGWLHTLKPWNLIKSNYSIHKMSRNSRMMGSPHVNSKSYRYYQVKRSLCSKCKPRPEF